mmetsp:Transcript_39765/g.29347  ORF Transcript_39765/g.29347 Transcript_39765/m.29347 type:complete len:142 (+) Transcript_39765:1825-2250(+)|eukprot:CAMPEP_0202963886 /NCGR_PEP_ID=MMETSP1396-20130829/7935_1 /ASSEMBLY_ACC=CAM_ASM_000872 /TAXON_ID= /ORGANISM="Pseudokeronopsis sp., Strain Brazil" /LENGTH=141 /DNA_ID=CAMNT_0049685523 /DNA_START=671 /DNA_END=1096 /DNA_ORIENTATION=-
MKAKSKSPLPKRYEKFNVDPREGAYSATPPPGARKSVKGSESNHSCLNITINKDVDKDEGFPKPLEEYCMSIQQPVPRSQERRGTLSVPRVLDMSSPRIGPQNEESKDHSSTSKNESRKEEYHFKISDHNLPIVEKPIKAV